MLLYQCHSASEPGENTPFKVILKKHNPLLWLAGRTQSTHGELLQSAPNFIKDGLISAIDCINPLRVPPGFCIALSHRLEERRVGKGWSDEWCGLGAPCVSADVEA